MFTNPASAEPGASGVGEYCTSMRDVAVIDVMSICAERDVTLLPPALAMLKPFTCTGTLAEGTPWIEMPRASAPASYSMLMPGTNLRNSPTLPSATAPNSSVETTLRMSGAYRCSLIAIAAAAISREVATTKSASRTVSPARAVAETS